VLKPEDLHSQLMELTLTLTAFIVLPHNFLMPKKSL
jgi:hypothetical protein